jgi:NAD(P)-dependent dehydrogenase (short-subunit alcohol dehydrogenase family)
MRRVLVAGGTGALGAGVLEALLEGGHPVTCSWLVDRERARVEQRFGDGVDLVEADLMTAEGAEAAVEASPELGAVVNLVGGFFSGPKAHETAAEDYEKMLTLNLQPGFNLVRAAFPTLLDAGGGAYVGVSARPALQPFEGSAAYSTAKAAVLAFVKSLAADYKNDGIRANAILPSVIDTPANRVATPDADFGRWVRPYDIGRVVRFLVSDDSAPTSGAAIPVYGRA